EVNFHEEDPERRASNLLKWFQHPDGQPYSLPFLREVLDNDTALMDWMHAPIMAAIGDRGKTENNISLRPDDSGKEMRMDKMMEVLMAQSTGSYGSDLVGPKWEFVGDLLRVIGRSPLWPHPQWQKLAERVHDAAEQFKTGKQARDMDPYRQFDYQQQVFLEQEARVTHAEAPAESSAAGRSRSFKVFKRGGNRGGGSKSNRSKTK
ncbi:hypothetical protein CALCODRAFT_537814, partial [Calocera cornea HHB12733]